MPIQYRKTAKFGPLRLYFTQRGLSSWGLKLGRWSWNSRTRSHRVDLPGPLAWRQKPRGRRDH